MVDDILNRLIIEPMINMDVKIENFALVHLGLRSLSQTTIPAELPTGQIMGETIDSQFKSQVLNLRLISKPKEKVKLIAKIKKDMEKAFDIIVESSSECKALNKWVKELGLRVNQVQVRPVVHEFYIYKNNDVSKQLQSLMRDRGKLRAKVMIKPDPARGNVQLAFPEEFDERWVKAMGELLGYPKCCVDQYASDRESGVNAELRASTQLQVLVADADPHVYFMSYFFPCSPTCDKALGKGKHYHDKLNDVSPELAHAYMGVLEENMIRVKHQPEIISKHLERLRNL